MKMRVNSKDWIICRLLRLSVIIAALVLFVPVIANSETIINQENDVVVYQIEDVKLKAHTPDIVGRSEGHHWFSSLHRISSDKIACKVSGSHDNGSLLNYPAALYKTKNKGRNWQFEIDIDSSGASSIQVGHDQILLMPYLVWPLDPEDRRNATAEGRLVAFSRDGKETVESIPIQFLSFPYDLERYYNGRLALFVDGNVLRLDGGRLFTTVYGIFAGESKYTNMSILSEDGGMTWRFQAVIADWRDIAEAIEGPSEANTIRLDDGRLMAVYRVGGGQDYRKSYSSDDGATWTEPEKLEGVYSVQPQLVKLKNGLILLAGGRPGLFLWICSDGKGNNWEKFNIAMHHNAMVENYSEQYSKEFIEGKDFMGMSTSYTGMLVVGPNEVLISYDRLANSWNGPPGPWGNEDMVFSVRIKVKRNGIVFDDGHLPHEH